MDGSSDTELETGAMNEDSEKLSEREERGSSEECSIVSVVFPPFVQDTRGPAQRTAKRRDTMRFVITCSPLIVFLMFFAILGLPKRRVKDFFDL